MWWYMSKYYSWDYRQKYYSEIRGTNQNEILLKASECIRIYPCCETWNLKVTFHWKLLFPIPDHWWQMLLPQISAPCAVSPVNSPNASSSRRSLSSIHTPDILALLPFPEPYHRCACLEPCLLDGPGTSAEASSPALSLAPHPAAPTGMTWDTLLPFLGLFRQLIIPTLLRNRCTAEPWCPWLWAHPPCSCCALAVALMHLPNINITHHQPCSSSAKTFWGA